MFAEQGGPGEMTAKDATLRRIAIVLASLPQPVSQKLLGSLQADMRTQVKVALQQLSDVDPLERRRALDGFARSLKQPAGSNPNQSDAAEVVFSRAALNARDQLDAATQQTAAGTLIPIRHSRFLQNVHDNQLLTQLASERPQTLAIVLASIPPSHAARLLPRFDLRVRSEAMRRIANLKEIPSELVEEIASHLRSNLQQTTAGFAVSGSGVASSDPGQRALNAILAQMSDEKPSTVPMSRITPGRAAASPVQPVVSSATGPAVATNVGPTASTNAAQAAASERPVVSSSGASAERRSVDESDAVLLRLTPEQLRDALGSVDTQTALLALCGLPRNTADAVLSLLPRKQAKQVREQLATLSSIELWQIDEAKETVAMVTRRASRPATNQRPQAAAA